MKKHSAHSRHNQPFYSRANISGSGAGCTISLCPYFRPLCPAEGGTDMGKISNTMNYYFSDNERFADLFNAVFFRGKTVVDPEVLSEGA